MKKIFLSLAIVMLFISGIASAQTPQGINYQAVARNSAGGLLSNSSISLRISILDNTATGTSVFTETHTVTTNALGLFTFVIGKGALVSGDFTKIDWSTNDKFLEVEMDSSGGSSFTVMGTSQLVSVPYALYADKAGNAKTYNAGSGISISNDSIINTSQDQKVNLTGTGGTSISGTYPAFTIKSTVYNPGKGISISNDSIINTAPDQKVTITGGGASAITGTYPNFTVSSSDSTMWKRNGASNIYYNGGNVGIGTTNPSSKLDVNGMGIFRHALYFPEKGIGTHIRIGMDSAYWGYIASSNPYTGFKQLNIDAKPLVLNSDSKSGDVLIANGGGYVGIGTASPSSVLEINDTSSWETSFQIDNSSVSPKNNWQLNVGGSNNSLIGSDAFGIYDGTISNSYRFVIDTGGRIGLGTTSPTYNLQIAPKGSNGGSFMIGTNSATGGYTDLVLLTSAQKGGYCEISSIKSAGSAYGVLTLNPKGGNVGIGTYSPSEKLSVSGNICYTGSIGSCSDRRYKTNILSMGSMLSNVMALAPVTYNWKVKEFPDKNFNDKKQLGFIAQDIEKIFPELVLTDQDGYKSVDYVKITPILVKAVQEQQSEIEALKKQNEQILAKLNSLEAGNNKASASIK